MIGSVGGFVAGLLIALLLATPALALGDWPNAPWAIPTANYVGSYVYGTPTSWGPHTGVDILTNNDCTPSGSGARGADVYAASNAQVVYLWWLWRMSDGSYQVHNFDGTGQLNVIGSTKYGVSLYDSSQPQASYQYYWHMADQQTFDSYVSTALQPNQTVTMGTYLGTQGNATGTGSVCTHLHFTASTSGTGDSWSAAVDPSPLLGPDLNDDANGRVPAGYPLSYNGPRHSYKDILWYEQWNNHGVTVASSTGSSFAIRGQWITGWAQPDWAASCDVNGDGIDDLLWYEYAGGVGKVTVATSTGAGFAPQGIWVQGFGIPDWAGCGDVTGDGKADLLWYEVWNNHGITVLASTGSGFNNLGQWATGFGKPDWVGIGDLNGDGKTDLYWYEYLNNAGFTAVLSLGNAFYANGQWMTGFGLPDWAGMTDVNSDGKADLLWYEAWNNHGITVATSYGSGMSLQGQWVTGWGVPDWAAAGDVNGDGRGDLVWYEYANNAGFTVGLSLGNGFSANGQWLTGFGRPDWAGLGDVAR
jgi:hypothetical protein